MEFYKGTIIENSLEDKSVLKDLKITKTYNTTHWTLHDVLITEKQIENLGKYFNDGPWYAHFWQEGNDEVIVVFKDKIFRIKHSDKNTWTDAIKHGIFRGIPEKQLDFVIM